MLGIIHHNANLDAELAGERVVERITRRIGRASGLPNDRIHKTVILSWQLELMNCIISNATGDQIDNADDELYDEFQDFENEFNENYAEPNDYDVDENWLNYFENVVNL